MIGIIEKFNNFLDFISKQVEERKLKQKKNSLKTLSRKFRMVSSISTHNHSASLSISVD